MPNLNFAGALFLSSLGGAKAMRQSRFELPPNGAPSVNVDLSHYT